MQYLNACLDIMQYRGFMQSFVQNRAFSKDGYVGGQRDPGGEEGAERRGVLDGRDLRQPGMQFNRHFRDVPQPQSPSFMTCLNF